MQDARYREFESWILDLASCILCPGGYAYTIRVISHASSAFRDRARYEADRYGWDPWVFVRELLQNSRDAGARRVWIAATRSEGRDRIECRDDGAGMSFEHARRYLFTLYASSKRGGSKTAGRFGIGFWSVLRFSPDAIIIRSRPAHTSHHLATRRGEKCGLDDGSDGWLVRLDGDLENTRREPTVMEPGTEIVLERPAHEIDLEDAIRNAVLRDAPFLSCRDKPERPLEVRINGRVVRSEPELPPPSLSFERRGLRGAVALGDEPRVEIFAHGLKVRDAASLDDLLLGGRPGRPPLPATSGGSAPRVLIDSRDLSVLMARGDAREDRALRRLVAIGHRELGRLVRAELDRHARATRHGGIGEWIRDLVAGIRLPREAVIGTVAVVIFGLGWFVLQQIPESGGTPLAVPTVGADPRTTDREPAPYRGLEESYRGPSVETLGRVSPPVDLHYRPADQNLNFAALLVTGLDADGVPAGDRSAITGPYRGRGCVESCVAIEMTVDAGAGVLRLPVPTGHAVDPDSVRLDDRPVSVVATAAGQPAIRLEAARAGRLFFRSSPGPGSIPTAGGEWPDLPAELDVLVADLDRLARSDRASVAADYVRRRVRYDRSRATSRSLLEARRRGLDLFSRTLAVGAGDCDVQNALLAGILDHVGVPSRLALGWVGSEGRVLAGLHAWVEILGADGRWAVVDASVDLERSSSPASDTPRKVVGSVASIADGRWMLIVGGALLVVVAAAVVLVRRSWRRSLRPGDGSDLSDLLRGAAARPEAFAGIRPLFNRRVVPLLERPPVSLAQARAALRRGWLGSGSSKSRLAVEAAAAGGMVIDGDSREGRAVAEALGSVDLDRWQEILEGARIEPLAERVEEALGAAGESCRLRVASEVGQHMAALDGRAFGLGRSSCWVVVDEESELWKVVCDIGRRQPARAALLFADSVVHLVGVPPQSRPRCLGALAEAALVESGGGAS